MDITSLEWEADAKGNPKISVWAKCHTVEDVDDIIAWLHLAKDIMPIRLTPTDTCARYTAIS